MIYSTCFVHAVLYNIGYRFCNANNTISAQWQEWRGPNRNGNTVQKPLMTLIEMLEDRVPRRMSSEHAASAHAAHASHSSSHAASWWTLLFWGFSDCNFSSTEQ